MIADAVERVSRHAGDDAWILVAGIKAVRARLLADLTAAVADRVLELESLDVHASDAEIADAARAGASMLCDALDSRRIHEIVEAAGPHGLGAVGAEATKEALDHVCVHQLYLTERYVAEHPAEAETAVRESLDQNARVEEVSAKAAELLDGLGGIAAALRFRPTATRATRAA
jgi:stalled ribosome rescue protein Dom34